MEAWMERDGTMKLRVDLGYAAREQMLGALVRAAQEMRDAFGFPNDHLISVSLPHGPQRSMGLSIEAELNRANIAIEVEEEE